MPTNWEYCILTRLSSGLDTKWHVNRVFQHHATELPTEVTDGEFKKLNAQFDRLHAQMKFPILPAVLNLIGAQGWELIDDMNTGMPGGEGLVFKRPLAARAKAPARRAAKKSKR
jgi:hypothetical protein